MNKRLQAILDLIQQSESLTPEEKKSLADAVKESDKEITITEFKLERTEKVKRTTAILLEETIAELEQKRKSVEAQNRELEIEAALERVRSRSIAMRQSSELGDLSFELVKQVQSLGIATWHCAFNIYDEGQESSTEWGSNSGGSYPIYKTPREGIFKHYYEIGQRGETLHVEVIGEDKCAAHYDYLCTLPGVGDTLVKVRDSGIPFPKSQIDHVAYFKYGYLLFITFEPVPDAHDTFKRFAKVFEQTYTRFLDLEKAEAQAREAQIEAALERVRSRSLAMHKSDELQEVVNTVFERLKDLKIEMDSANIAIFKDGTRDFDYWIASPVQNRSAVFHLPYIDSGITKDLMHAKENGWDFFGKSYSFEEKNEWFNYGFEHTDFKFLDEDRKQLILSAKFISVSVALAKNTGVQINSYSERTLSEGEIVILKRFAKVFEQAYTRFLDLQKAEAQTRAAHIEVTLERVRARVMGMHHSDELSEVLSVLFDQFDVLGISPVYTFLSLIDLDKNKFTYRQTGKGGQRVIAQQVIDLDKMEEWKDLFENMRAGKIDPINCLHYPKESLEKVWEVFDEIYAALPDGSKVYPEDFPDGVYTTQAYCKFGYLGFDHTRAATEEDKDILQRFAKEFTRLYQRFLDLQKAEAQAKEAQIEAALERVRSRAMAMQTSEELNALIGTVFSELTKLDLVLTRCVIMTYDQKTNDARWWMANSEAPDLPMNFYVQYHEHKPNLAYFSAWRERKVKFIYPLEGTIKKEWDEFIFSQTELRLLPDFVIAGMKAPDRVYLNASFYNSGNLTLASLEPLSDEHFDILIRFAKVFDLTYTRFNDLKQAEAQAKEARIEAALERIRSRTMGMQKSTELKEVIQLVYDQFVRLNILIEHTGFIVDYKASDDMNIWLADKHDVPAFVSIPYFDSPHWNSFIKAKEQGTDFFTNHLTFEEKNKFYQTLFTFIPGLSAEAKEYYSNCPGLAISTVLLENIGLYIENFSGIPYSDEENNTLIRFGKVFQQTYTRFLDLQKAEAQAREAHIEAALERVRSRTMAMQRSEELVDVASVLFQQVKALGVPQWNCGFNIWDIGDKEFTYYPGSPDGIIAPSPCKIPLTEHPVFMRFDESRKRGEELLIYEKEGEEQRGHYQYMLSLRPGVGDLLQSMLDSGFQLPTFQIDHVANFAYGNLIFITFEHFPEMHDVFKRFAKVFEQTYTRFLDLQQAEGQAREAQIQLALERVRARTMAMQHSNELRDAASLLIQQVKELGIEAWTCGYGIWNEDKKTPTAWLSRGTLQPPFKTPLTENPTLMHFYEAAQRGDSLFVEEVQGEVLAELYRYLGSLLVSQGISSEVRQPGYTPPTYQINHVAYFSYGYLLFVTYKKYPEAHDIFIRFAKVFEQTYTRFLDLEKAEAQVRESHIEASLERVRGKTMAMHNSQDVGDTVATVFDELLKLNIKTNRCGILIFGNSTDSEVWTARSAQTEKVNLIIGHLDVTRHPMLTMARNAWKNKEPSFTYELIGDDLVDYYRMINNQPDYPMRVNMDSLPSKEIHTEFYFPDGAVFAFTSDPIATEDAQIFKRLASVFGQTYRRYLDLQKAEAQAREAQIEASLERVRSKSMAMHKSEEILEVVKTMCDQFIQLGFEFNVVNIGTDFRNPDHDLHVWIYGKDAGNIYPHRVRIPYIDNALLFKIKESLEKKVDFFSITLSKGEKDEFYQHLFSNTIVGSLIPDERKQFLINEAIFSSSIYILRHTLIILVNYNGRTFSEEHDVILKRFANVFEQSYTRFMDLQKAEAQAREAQIETALERVRSRTMAMHESKEIADIVGRIFKELTLLHVALNRVLIWIFNPAEKYITWWSANPEEETNAESYRVDYFDHPVFLAYYGAWQKRTPLLLYELGDDLKASWEDHLFMNTELSRLPKAVQDGMRSERKIFTTSAISDYGLLMAGSFEPFSDEVNDIIQRFGRVFQQSYTRYLDVQKAEEQAREATIEASLEKVRGKAMGMHDSKDLAATASLVFTELKKLGINTFRSGVGLLTKENRNVKLYSAASSEEGGSFSVVGWAVLDHHPVLSKTYDSWINNEDYYPVLKGDTLKSYYEKVVATFNVPVEQSEGYEQHGYFLPFSEGMFYGWSEKPYTETQIKILHRFRGIVDLTFRRYIELQKSEENAREAIRQASLDRVRAEIASMRTTSDLDRITPLIWKELNILSIPFVRCGVFIMDDFQQLMHTFLSTPEGEAIAAFHLPYETPGNTGEILSHWKNKQMYIKHWDERAFSELGELLVQQGAIPSKEVYMNTVPLGGIHLHCLPFLQGMLYVGNTTQLQDSDIHLIQSVADAFSTAYARYEDFNKLESAKAQIERTLTDLKQTQTLLVQSEKMASLGELTAGIAHEIQNPLNFVNNFSEVSNELLGEMKEEIQKGNYKEVEAITENIKQNLDKILHHGKRADGIVKGMLQHSRSSSGVKEPTDINALVDEYLRLAYHGFRAKDKSFKASTTTDLDKSIGKVNVVPQDIGRVVLNLITNAFYAVTEKQNQTTGEYRPTVSLTTKRHDGCVLICVQDNGKGIPSKVLDKIFQPFFTTKPTGQGTGLGLSLSYDIVKAHGGELKVETAEGEGSTFVIQLACSRELA